jgi:DNA-binding Lrp family transcriptional regulator
LGLDFHPLAGHCQNTEKPTRPGLLREARSNPLRTRQKESFMITAIVMINCEVGKVSSVSEALMDLDGVAEVYSISGQYDILAIIRVKEYDSLADVVSEKIARIKGIARTHTHMAFRCYSKHDMEKMWSSSLEA